MRDRRGVAGRTQGLHIPRGAHAIRLALPDYLARRRTRSMYLYLSLYRVYPCPGPLYDAKSASAVRNPATRFEVWVQSRAIGSWSPTGRQARLKTLYWVTC